MGQGSARGGWFEGVILLALLCLFCRIPPLAKRENYQKRWLDMPWLRPGSWIELVRFLWINGLQPQ